MRFHIAFCLILPILFYGFTGESRDEVLDRNRSYKEMDFVAIAGGKFHYAPDYLSLAVQNGRELKGQDIVVEPFLCSETEVTRGLFRSFVDATGYRTDAEKAPNKSSGIVIKNGAAKIISGCTWKDCGFEQTDDHPVVCVSVNDVTAFCSWMNQEGCPCRMIKLHELFYISELNGDTEMLKDANTKWETYLNLADSSYMLARNLSETLPGDDKYVFTCPVKSMNPGKLKVYQIMGNSMEMCMFSEFDPEDRQKALHCHTGGSWEMSRELAMAVIPARDKTRSFNAIGFRLVIDF